MGHAITPTASKPLAKAARGFHHLPDPREFIFDLNTLALAIADAAVRSDIECFARCYVDDDGRDTYDLSRSAEGGKTDPPSDAAVNAARYIDRRGDVFPWRMLRRLGAPHLVRFEAKA